MRARVGSSFTDFDTHNGSGGWATDDSEHVEVMQNGTTRELRIRWDGVPGLSERPAAFNWLAFELKEMAALPQMDNPMPSSNTANAKRLQYFFAVSNAATADPSATQQSTWLVTDGADSGAFTLRSAIESANGDSASTRRFIVFDILTPIGVTTALPTISRTTTVDGTTQSGWTNAAVVVINGGGARSSTAFGPMPRTARSADWC